MFESKRQNLANNSVLKKSYHDIMSLWMTMVVQTEVSSLSEIKDHLHVICIFMAGYNISVLSTCTNMGLT